MNRREFIATASAAIPIGLVRPVQIFQDRPLTVEVLQDIAKNMLPSHMLPKDMSSPSNMSCNPSVEYSTLLKEILEDGAFSHWERYYPNGNCRLIVRTESEMKRLVEKHLAAVLQESKKAAFRASQEIAKQGWLYNHIGLLRKCYYFELYGFDVI